jgi:zinc and cadmium transporter
MLSIFLISLFIITFICGMIPLFIAIRDDWNSYLLAFSGAVLLSITFLHLVPETVEELGHKAGIYILIGFFLQLFLQKFSHGIEHGHSHVHDHDKTLFFSIFLGLSVHAFLEGIPLGHNYGGDATLSSYFIGVAAHKIPEVLTLMTFMVQLKMARNKKLLYLLAFAFFTPLAGIISAYFDTQYAFTNKMISMLVPIVMGAFIHISTTIFFESGAQHHQLNFKKILSVLVGIGVALLTMIH